MQRMPITDKHEWKKQEDIPWGATGDRLRVACRVLLATTTLEDKKKLRQRRTQEIRYNER